MKKKYVTIVLASFSLVFISCNSSNITNTEETLAETSLKQSSDFPSTQNDSDSNNDENQTNLSAEQSSNEESSESQYYGDYDKQEVEEFAKKIKEYISNDQKEHLADLVSYPIVVSKGTLTINSREEFIENYDEIINQTVKEAISTASTTDMFSNYLGVMMGDGDIWFGYAYEKDGLWIIAINNE